MIISTTDRAFALGICVGFVVAAVIVPLTGAALACIALWLARGCG